MKGADISLRCWWRPKTEQKEREWGNYICQAAKKQVCEQIVLLSFGMLRRKYHCLFSKFAVYFTAVGKVIRYFVTPIEQMQKHYSNLE